MNIDQNDPRVLAAVEAFNQGDLKKEASILEPLLDEYPDDANILQRVGAVVAQLGDVEKAKGYLNRALTIEPENNQVLSMLTMIGGSTADGGIEQQGAADSQAVKAQIDSGNAHLVKGDVAAARAAFEDALQTDPNAVGALVNLASLCEREHRFEEAYKLAERAVALAPNLGQANILLSRIELRLGSPQEAVDRMYWLVTQAGVSQYDKGIAQYLIGQALDKVGEFDNAFTVFEAANDTFHRVHAPSVATSDSVLAPDFLGQIHAFFEKEDFSSWTTLEKSEEPTPVFLLGFPRSGTTLLDQILKTHSAIDTLEEKENFIDVRKEIVRPDGGLNSLGAMNDDDINQYRKKYWAQVREHYSDDNTGKILIDKMPLNTILLGLIYRFFPNAKIIFAVRDPRDAVLSCFQQRFGINVAMFQFLKLDTAAAYYDQVMKIGEVCRTRLPLDVHMVRYEDVVGDMQNTVTDTLSFLGLEWEDQLVDYREKARDRWITTPSAEQVIEPLYTSSMGKWRNYERHMAPVLPVLEPWAKKFGYEPS